MTMASDEACEEKQEVPNESKSSEAAVDYTSPEALVSGRVRLKNSRKRYPLVKYQDLPSHLKGNEFILDHYRCDWPLRETVLSLFSVHNETLNIWTHLVGFLIFVGLAFYTAILLPKLIELSALPSLTRFEEFILKKERDSASALLPPESPITRWPFYVFLGGAMCCLLFSSTYHLLNCHTRRLHDVLHRLDHAGIAVLIAASFFPPIYYSFLCYPGLRNMYLGGITTISLSTIVFSSLESFRSHEFRKYRALLFFCTGASGIIPGAHRIVLYWNEPLAFQCLWYEVAMGVLYGLGALLYAARVPERLKPGRFDIVGHSHQIFHILVVLAALAHYKAGLLDMQWRESHGCPT
ncbi:hypothetical protein R1sor_020118 [Riccia sorocarpa]|uniref:Uncharacterized protein n=1 Tax=Riccia sorocarpa TaxID=122646 RepID=A0ABD3IF44_9MARC